MSTLAEIVLKADMRITVLSGRYAIEKTERMVNETAGICGIDSVLTKIFEAIVTDIDHIRSLSGHKNACYKVDTSDRQHSFFCRLTKDALIFYKYVCRGEATRKNDQRILQWLAESEAVRFYLRSISPDYVETDFAKLYRLSNDDRVNFPFLNAEQEQIVVTEDKNELVQGVAGSGKTNICIDKIVFAAGRGYAGRVLYSTYSRGLLIDTRTRLQVFRANLLTFVRAYEEGNVIFADSDRRRAIENKLGIYFTVEDTEKICDNIRRIATFLDEKVDYMLPEDMYRRYFDTDETVADEAYFVKTFLPDPANHHMAGRLNRLRSLSPEIIYKEIFGMIYGRFDPHAPADMMSEAQYINERSGSFSAAECSAIYMLAQDYRKHLEKKGLTDNNFISRRLLAIKENIARYSLTVLDEAQDMTEVSLYLLSEISGKMCCVGDALQMINPSFFSFAYLKRLLFERDETAMKELKNNYRNTARIAQIVNALGDLNVRQFGSHNFVLRGVAVESRDRSNAVYVKDKDLITAIADKRFDDLTVVVANSVVKGELRKRLKKTEILTVSEIKGLEREVVVLYNVLSTHKDKWQQFGRIRLNRKTADENSVYRYYFNLFYVGVSRAKRHLYVNETDLPVQFEEFFAHNFERSDTRHALDTLGEIVSTLDIDTEELITRIRQFLRLGQYDNARFTTNRISDDRERHIQLNHIDVYEHYIRHGRHRDAGIRYWELGMFDDAKAQFDLSGDTALKDMIDACQAESDRGLDVGIVRFLPDLKGNETAERLIMEVLRKDYGACVETQKNINEKLRALKHRRL